jgi:hypothetical protein
VADVTRTVRWCSVLLFVLGASVIGFAVQPPAEGAMGRTGDPFEVPVRMSGEAGHILASGLLEAAVHESEDGFFSVGKFSISVPRDGIAAMALRERLKQDVEIVIRRKQPRTIERIDR